MFISLYILKFIKKMIISGLDFDICLTQNFLKNQNRAGRIV